MGPRFSLGSPLPRSAGLGFLDQKTITTWKQMVFRAVHEFKAPLILFIINAVEKRRFFGKFF
jgi:hypothetical protein